MYHVHANTHAYAQLNTHTHTHTHTQLEPDSCTTDEELYFALHKQVCSELMIVITSEQDHLEVRSKVFDPINGHTLYQDLVASVNHYVSEIRQQISVPLLVQVSAIA